MELTTAQRADVLTQALPYIKKYYNKIIVVTYGGNAMINEELKDAVMGDIVLLSLIFFLMVHSIVKNFEYQREISDLESQIEVLNVRAAELRLELEARDDIAEIERRAEEIGMIKSGKVEEKYISLDNSEIIENFTRDEDGYGSFTTMLSAVSRQLSKFLGGE